MVEPFQFEIMNIVKIILAVAIATIVGFEREKSGKPVGVRTLSLVCLGSTLATLLSLEFGGEGTARVLAGIVTGIGFLGAGSIIAHRESVKGLTTAATVWAMAVVGIAIGMGRYVLSIVITIIIYLVLIEGKIMTTLKQKDEEEEKKIKKKK